MALEELEAGHTQLRADLMGRMDRLQDTITIIRDDVRVNFGRADAVQRVAENVRIEARSLYQLVNGVRDDLLALNNVVSGMEREIHHLQSEVQSLRGGA